MPNAILEAGPSLRAFLASELRYQLDLALDQHVLSQILNSDVNGPDALLDGADLIAQIRNAISFMRESGLSPSVVVMAPEDAALLDLDTRGADDAYTFATRNTGSASPLWGLRVVEAVNVTDRILIDPVALGRLYLGGASLDVDSSGSEFKANLSTLRLEFTTLFHVSNIAGALLIAAAS